MIKQETYKTGLASASELESVGIYLKARPATVLGDLVALSSSFQEPPNTNLPTMVLRSGMNRIQNSWTAEERAVNVEMMTVSYDKSSLHSLKIEALADDIAPFITSHLSHVRNTVAPLVTELTEKLQRFQETAKAIDPSTSFEIVECKVPEFLLDDSFVSGGLENYDTSSVDYPYETRCINNQMAENLGINWHDSVKMAEFLNVGNDRLNKMIFEWISTLPEGFMDKTFHSTFADYEDDKYKPDWKFNLPGKHGSQTNIYHSLNVLTASFLISSSIMRVTKGVKLMGVEKIRDQARKVLDYCGGMINRHLRTITRQVTGNVMVNEVDTGARKAYVHEPVYAAWLQKGGSPDAILGMIASGQVYHDVQAIDEASAKLMRSWSAYVTLSQTEVRQDLRNRLVTYIKSEVLHGLNDLTPIEVEYANGDQNFRQKVAAHIEKEIERLGHRITEDLAHTALHLIAKARFFYTSAYTILSQMEEVSKHSPDIDPREAALLATITYIGEYFENQLVVER